MIFVFVCLAFEECRRPSLSEEQPVAAYDFNTCLCRAHSALGWDVEGCGMEVLFSVKSSGNTFWSEKNQNINRFEKSELKCQDLDRVLGRPRGRHRGHRP